MSLAEPRLVDAPAQPTLQIRLEASTEALGPEVGDALSRLTDHANARQLGCGPAFVRRLRDAGGRVEVVAGVCVQAAPEDPAPFEAGALPSGKLACGVWTGDFGSLSRGHAQLSAWAEAQGHAPAGAPWEVPVTGPHDVSRADRARTQLYLPVQ